MRISILAAVLVAAVRAAAATSVEQTVAQFHAAWGAGDARALAYWVPGTAEAAAFERAFARTRAARCIDLRGVAVSDVREEGDSAVANVAVVTRRWSDMPGGRPWDETTHAAIALVRVDGMWKIRSLTVREEELARRAAALERPEDGSTLLQADPELRTPAVAIALSTAAARQINENRFADAARVLDLADDVAVETGDDRARAHALLVRAALHDRLGHAARSLELATEAVAAAERTGDPDALARALVRRGRSVVAADGWDRAVESFHRALSSAEFIENAGHVTRAAAMLAWYSDLELRHRDALRYAELASRYAAMSDDVSAKMTAFRNLGGAYLSQGDDELALPHLVESRRLAEEARYPSMVADIDILLASILRNRGELEAAERYLLESLELTLPHERTGILSALGALWIRRGDWTRATESMWAAYESAQQSSEPACLADAWLGWAELRLKQKRWAEALAMLEEAARIDPALNESTQIQRARALRAMGRTAEARTLLEEASCSARRDVFVLESRRPLLRHDQARDATLELADLFVDLGEPRRAFLAAQRFRNRELLSAVAREHPPLRHILTPAQRAEHRAREQRVVELNRELGSSGDAKSAESLRAELAAARLAVTDFETRARAAFDGVYARASREADEEAVPEVPEGLVVVEFLVLEERTVIFTLSRESHGATAVRSHAVPIARTELASRIDDFVARIERRELGYGAAARRLYDLLFAPIEPLIAGKTLCIVPRLELWRLPMHALQGPDGRHVAEMHAVFYAPSASLVETDVRRGQPEAELLAFANPAVAIHTAAEYRSRYRNARLAPLPEAEAEARAVARLYDADRSRVYVGAAAREADFKVQAGRYRVLHIATHGILDGKSPMFSSLLLSAGEQDAAEDGLLEAREIANLRLSADVAVLAACETARGATGPGEAVAGMSWALLVAGCPNAVVSQWKAESAATAKLMVELHRGLVSGVPIAEAMRRAQRALMRDRRYAHPLYWAPFVVIGTGRR